MSECKNEKIDSSGPEPMLSEAPIVVLQPNESLVFFTTLFIAILYLFLIFGVILPVLNAGSFALAWPNYKKIWEMILLFYLSWPMLMFLPFFLLMIRKVGTYHFYNDRLEFEPFITRRKILMPYKKMYIHVCGKRGVLIMREKLPDWSCPIKRLKVQYLQALELGSFTFHENKISGVRISNGLWLNPSDGPKALQLLREKAMSVTEERN